MSDEPPGLLGRLTDSGAFDHPSGDASADEDTTDDESEGSEDDV